MAFRKNQTSCCARRCLGIQNEASIVPYAYNLGYTFTPVSTRVIPSFARKFREQLKNTISPDINEMNQKLDIFFTNSSSFLVVPRRYLTRGNLPSNDTFSVLYLDFKAEQDPSWRTYLSVYGYYRNHLEDRYAKSELPDLPS